MRVDKHLLNDIKPLSLNDTVKDLLDLMEELKFSHLPVCDGNHYLGLICEDDLLEAEKEESPLRDYQRMLKPYSVFIFSNIFEAIRISGEGNLSLLPVQDGEGIYKGYICPLELIQDLGRQLTFQGHGSVLVLEFPIRDFQLSQISQIVESEEARITGFLMDSSGDMDNVSIALKINQKDLGRILKSFERYEYKVLEVYHESMFDDTLDQRYEALMKYLSM